MAEKIFISYSRSDKAIAYALVPARLQQLPLPARNAIDRFFRRLPEASAPAAAPADNPAPQQVEITPQGLRLTLRRGTLDGTNLPRIDGVLVLQGKGDRASPARAFTISAVPAKAS